MKEIDLKKVIHAVVAAVEYDICRTGQQVEILLKIDVALLNLSPTGLRAQAGFLHCALEGNFFFFGRGPQSLLLTEWMRPTQIMESKLLYSVTDVDVNYI